MENKGGNNNKYTNNDPDADRTVANMSYVKKVKDKTEKNNLVRMEIKTKRRRIQEKENSK